MREDEFTELKRTTAELNAAMNSISSILNKHRRGKVYFGFKDNGEPFEFTISNSTLRDVSRKIYEAIKPQIFPTVLPVTINSHEVIEVSFEGDDVPYSSFGKYFIRTADEDKELTPHELRQIMIGREYEENWENKMTDETVDDVDEKTLKRFYEKAVECNRMPDLGFEKKTILSNLGVIRGNYLTNAGKMLFSKNQPIFLKCAVFATEYKETFLDIDTVRGNIFQLIDTALSYIIKNIRWRVELDEIGIHRKEIPEVPIEALREAVINCFAHARYDTNVEHEIDIFSNRISIINPGAFANEFEPIDFVNNNIHSYLRNSTIAHVLYLSKDVETFGSGIRKIYSLCDVEGIEVTYVNSDLSFMISFRESTEIKFRIQEILRKKSANLNSWF